MTGKRNFASGESSGTLRPAPRRHNRSCFFRSFLILWWVLAIGSSISYPWIIPLGWFWGNAKWPWPNTDSNPRRIACKWNCFQKMRNQGKHRQKLSSTLHAYSFTPLSSNNSYYTILFTSHKYATLRYSILKIQSQSHCSPDTELLQSFHIPALHCETNKKKNGKFFNKSKYTYQYPQIEHFF